MKPRGEVGGRPSNVSLSTRLLFLPESDFKDLKVLPQLILKYILRDRSDLKTKPTPYIFSSWASIIHSITFKSLRNPTKKETCLSQAFPDLINLGSFLKSI